MANKQTNVIEVGFKKKVQPVRIGGMGFEIQLGEKFRQKYMQELPVIEAELIASQSEMEAAIQAGDWEKARELTEAVTDKIRECVDLLLGDGAFDKLYEAADEDSEVVLEAFSEVAERYRNLQTKRKAKSYIEGKKRG